jgi:hypothetical protein
MPLELSPIDPAQLSDALRKVIGPAAPAPLKLMAARGLAPLGPRDLVTALYQLAVEPDEKVADAARQSAMNLPDRVLQGALGEALDPRVLDHLARLAHARAGVVELVLLNRATHDDTFVHLAAMCEDRELEIIAQAEERCLRSPAIVEALYLNRRTRMSTVDRLVELCVRHGVVLEKIPHYKETAAAILAGEAEPAAVPETQTDELFRAVVEIEHSGELDSDETDEVVGEILEKPEARREDPQRVTVNNIKDLKLSAKMRLATVGTAFHRAILIRDSNKQVALAAIRSPAVSDNEVARYSANRSLCEDVIRVIANTREFLKHYQVKLNLVTNPKCPLPTALRLLQYLRENDLRMVSRSKGVAATLSSTAKRLLDNKKR